MQENEKKPQCWNCDNFSRHYVKGYSQFNRLETGRCRRDGKIKNRCDGCEKWRARICISKGYKRSLKRNMYEILQTLSQIKQIIQENIEDV